MIIVRTIAQICILWLFYLIGLLIVEWTGIIIPASIIGLVLLWLSLMLKIIDVRLIKDGASFLIGFMTLFFIPSTVGVIEYPELLSTSGLLLVVAVIISTILAIVITGKVSQMIERKERSEKGEVRHGSSSHHY